MADRIREYFVCDKCGSKDFLPRHSFVIELKTVNFSDDLIYDKIIEECYECKGCGECIKQDQIDAGLRELEHKHKNESNIS
jgi:hypothetical protein